MPESIEIELPNLYLLTQTFNKHETAFKNCVVSAKNEVAARNIHPSKYIKGVKNNEWISLSGEPSKDYLTDGWVPYSKISSIKVKLLGKSYVEENICINNITC